VPSWQRLLQCMISQNSYRLYEEGEGKDYILAIITVLNLSGCKDRKGRFTLVNGEVASGLCEFAFKKTKT